MSKYKTITTEAEVEVDIYECMDSLTDKELDEYITTRTKNNYYYKEKMAEEAVNSLIANKDYLDQLSKDKLKLNCGDLLS